jgi:rhodanese-related sulfurtransferase
MPEPAKLRSAGRRSAGRGGRRDVSRSGDTDAATVPGVTCADRSTPAHSESDGDELGHDSRLPQSDPPRGGAERRSLEGLVNEAAARIIRFSALDAFSVSSAGGLIIDIRSQDARELHGVVPRSLHIPRTVLEWRVALESPWRNRYLGGVDQRLILLCDHGYSSILAASNLVQLGFYRAGDVIGGFESWKEQGLPFGPCRPRLSKVDALPGAGPPD